MVEPQNAAFFPTTCWSQLGPGAAEGGDGITDRALERLASRYWRPIRDWLSAELRLDRDAAAELTQDFFVWVIESGFLKKADPERGRFRAFLKVALRNYARDANRRATTARRGGGRRFFLIDGPIDGPSEEQPFDAPDPERTLRPDELLDARWRRRLVQTALQELEAEFAKEGKSAMFATFRDYFLDASPDVDYRAVAQRNGITVTDVTNWLTRAKKRFREHLLAIVTDTVRDAAALDEELRWLFQRPEHNKDAP
jgi:RNA polymerase sigma-70 factor (ECF subfamily)